MNARGRDGVSYYVLVNGVDAPDGDYCTTVTIPVEWDFNEAVEPVLTWNGGAVWETTGSLVADRTGHFELSTTVYNGASRRVAAPTLNFVPLDAVPTVGGFDAPIIGVGIGRSNGGGSL